jgi:hypothetical protein
MSQHSVIENIKNINMPLYTIKHWENLFENCTVTGCTFFFLMQILKNDE